MGKAISELEKSIRREVIKEGRKEGERTNAIQNTRMLFRNGVSLELVTASILVLTKEEICQSENIEIGMLPYSQAMLFARVLRGDLDEYPPY